LGVATDDAENRRIECALTTKDLKCVVVFLWIGSYTTTDFKSYNDRFYVDNFFSDAWEPIGLKNDDRF
jgi:hypothetical protein